MNSGEVTQYVRRVVEGDERAVEWIWQQYYPQLLPIARRRLGTAGGRVVDEEDIVAAALETWQRHAAAGDFPQLDNRLDLWRLLLTITVRKAGAQVRHNLRICQGGGKVQGESGFVPGADSQHLGIQNAPDNTTGPALRAEMEELLDQLQDAELRQVALLKLDGFTAEEIADKLVVSPRTVERRLNKIRQIWEKWEKCGGQDD